MKIKTVLATSSVLFACATVAPASDNRAAFTCRQWLSSTGEMAQFYGVFALGAASGARAMAEVYDLQLDPPGRQTIGDTVEMGRALCARSMDSQIERAVIAAAVGVR